MGPFKDIENAGVILAQTENREEMGKIIFEDAFYPDGAKYELHEFDPKLIAEDIKKNCLNLFLRLVPLNFNFY